ncbi:sugar phosphate isomerase/epimerase [Halobacteria archaeon AArc-dxtr1]|nr:sugar phosphate isomerase/epimerase [Halobacteria archaeon AArc-dxtr1]
MTDENRSATTEVQTPTTGPTANRRRVLQGVAALGVSGGLLGTGAAQRGGADQSRGRTETPIAIQLWTIQALGLSTAEEIRAVAGAGYDAVEPYTIDDPDEVEKALDETGLDVAGAHVGLGALEDDFEATVDRHTQVGVETFTVPSAPGELFDSEEGVRELASRFNELADKLAERGLEFGFHNHHTEFVDLGDRTAFDLLVEETTDDVRFQIEPLAAVGGENPVSLISKIGERVDSIHMRDLHKNVPAEEAAYDVDGTTWDFAEIGDGDMPMNGIATTAQARADVDWLIYEHNPVDPESSIEAGAEVLSTLNSVGGGPKR